MIRILIVDDHTVVRAGMKQILDETPGLEVSDEAANGRQALDLITKNDYDVILLDVSMPGMSGLDVLREIKTIKPHSRVLVLSMHSEELYAVRFFKAGAMGYVTKDSPMTQIIEAINKVANGGKYVSPAFAAQYIYDLEYNEGKPLHERLSNREYQVMCMIASGKTVSEIADELALSVKTISTNRSRIMQKMNMRTNAELTHYAIKNGLVE